MWAAKRRLLIFLSFCVVLFLMVAVPIWVRNAAVKPTCTDGRQNGQETGVDCGGSCVDVCNAQSLPLVIEWSRAVPVTSSVFDLAFMVQNRNYDAIGDRVPYRCSLLDKDYNVLKKEEGNVSFSPAGKSVVAITGLAFNDGKVPETASCELSTNHRWLRLPKQSLPAPFLFQSIVLDQETTRPHASTTMSSTDPLRTFRNLKVVAAAYDVNDTLVAVSTTVVDRVQPSHEYNLVFTWPRPFTGTEPYRVEFTPLFEYPEYTNSSNG